MSCLSFPVAALNGAHSPRDGGGEGSPPPQSSTGHAAAGNQPGQQSHHCNSSGASAPKASATSSQSGPGSAAPPVPLGGEQLTFATAAAPSPNVRQISKLKRFLTTLHQFACDISSDVGQRVHALVTGLVVSIALNERRVASRVPLSLVGRPRRGLE